MNLWGEQLTGDFGRWLLKIPGQNKAGGLMPSGEFKPAASP